MTRATHRRPSRGGWTLIELCVGCTLLVLLGALGVSRYSKAMEQSSLDLASAQLESVWTAQRFYWLEKGRYARNFNQLRKEGLLDSRIGRKSRRYTFRIRSADERGFIADAERVGSKRWKGRISITEEGDINGGVQSKGGRYLVPAEL